jgi:hypothetical protein
MRDLWEDGGRMSDPFDPLCVDCGLPYSEHTRDADVEDEQARIAEFRREVTARVEAKMADHYAVKAKADRLAAGRRLDERGIGLTAAHRLAIEVELRVVEKMAEYHEIKRRVDRKVFEHHIANGTAEFITSDGRTLTELGKTVLISPSMRTEYFAAKDAPALETRDA